MTIPRLSMITKDYLMKFEIISLSRIHK